MISHRYRAIFVHIPKTGGTSVEEVLWPRPRSQADLWMGFTSRFANKYQTGGLQHLFARHIRQEVGRDAFTTYFKFSFVRNPWDKAISQFFSMQRRDDLREFIGMKPGDCFKTYLERIAKKQHVQWEPQHRFLLDDNGELLVDRVGRFEHFERDLRAVLARLGVEVAAVPHRNRTSHGPYQEYYDPESVGMVEEMYAEDIARFGYHFGVHPGRCVRTASETPA